MPPAAVFETHVATGEIYEAATLPVVTSAASITASALVFAAPVLTLLIITRCPPAHHVITW